MSNAAWKYIAGRPWAIHPDALDGILALAERDTDGVAEAFGRLQTVSADTVPAASPEMVSARGGDRLDRSWSVSVRDGVAVVPVRGVISRYATMMHKVCREGTSVEMLAKDLRECLENPNVKAVLLDVDSPGGEASGIGELAAMVRQAAATKPVCAYVGGCGASAAYWLASAASEVVCHETAMLGSVGVLISLDTKTKPGEVTIVSAKSPMKRADVTTDAGKAEMQALVDALADSFIGAVAGYRDTTTAKVESDFGRGGLKTGKAAVSAGMADRTGSFESLLAELSGGTWAAPVRTKPDDDESKPGKPGKPKGAPPTMSFLAKLVGKIAGSNPEVLEAAMQDADGGDADLVKRLEAFAGKSEKAPVETVSADTVSEIEARAEAKAAATVRGFFATQADTYVASLVKAEKVSPADAPLYAAAYVDFAVADHMGVLSFADAAGKATTASRLGLFESLADARPAKKFTQTAADAAGNLVIPEGVKTLKNDDPDADAEAERKARRARMLGATPEGQSALKS